MTDDQKLLRAFLNVAVPVVEILVVLYVAPRFLGFFFPFVIAWFLALITSPLVRWLDRHLHIMSKHSAVVMVLLMLGLVILVLYGVSYVVVTQVLRFAGTLPGLYDTVVTELNRFFQNYDRLFTLLPVSMQQTIEQLTGDVGTALGVLIQRMASPTFMVAQSAVRSLPNLIVYTIVTVLAAYYMIADREKFREFAKKNIYPYVPKAWKRCFICLRKEWRGLVGGYFLAQAKLMLVAWAICLAGLLILRVQFAFLWSLLLAILDFLPIVGAGTALIPWAVYKVITREYAMAVGLLLLYIITQVVRQTIQPKIVGDTMGLPFMTTLIFLFIGYRLYGFLGMILAVPVGILLIRMADDGIFDPWFANVKELLRLWEARP